MNKVMIIGRLTKDPEARATQTGMSVTSFTVAVDRFKQGEADFIPCKAFDKTADTIAKLCHKGTKVAVEGRIQTGSYEGKNGKVYTTDVIVERFEFCESKSASAEAPAKKPVDEFMAIPDGLQEELPFN